MLKIRVWWDPQVGRDERDPFVVYVDTMEKAKLVYDTLAEYDLYQYETAIKPDYANAGGIDVFKDDEWESEE